VSEAACARYYATGGSLPDSNQSPKAVSAEDKEAVPKKTLVGRAVHSTKKVVTFIKEGIHHYWLGSKLLALNVRTAFNIAVRLKNGHTLTRRERQHMIRTTADLFRLVPFAVFVIVPFMEFLLPIALKIFPNMLPSTFQDTMKKEEDMRKQLLLKLKMASFLQDTLQEMAETGETHADIPKEEFLDFMKRVRGGGEVSGEEVLKFAKLFKDDFTIMNLSRAQLSSICKFLNLRPYGTDAFMRWQISRRVSKLREDDTMIAQEGVKSLTFEELQQACIARGMPATGLSKVALREQLEEWLDSSLNEQLPAVILILSRALSLTTASQKVDAALRETISTLPEDVVEEAELEMDLQKGTPSDRQLKLEVLRNTNEKLREELEEEAETFKEIEALESPGSVIPEEDAEHLRDVAEALSVLASPVSAERKALEQLEAREALLARAKTLKDQEAATVVDAVVKAVKTRSDRSKERLGQQLEDLLDDLREELSETEQKLGDKMVLIDKDRDGVITTEEVALACSLLKDRPSDAEIRNVLRVLDADEDGVVALEDVQKIRQKLEELHLEEAPAEEKERK
jgi:LETM1 and EF-hand domain-containing protein 1